MASKIIAMLPKIFEILETLLALFARARREASHLLSCAELPEVLRCAWTDISP